MKTGDQKDGGFDIHKRQGNRDKQCRRAKTCQRSHNGYKEGNQKE